MRQHVRHVYRIPDASITNALRLKASIQYIDPALFVLTGHRDLDRRLFRQFLGSPDYEEPGDDAARTLTYRNALRAGLPFDPLEIVLKSDGTEAYGDGTHRAMAAISAGIRRVPVVISMVNQEPFDPEAFKRWKALQIKRMMNRHFNEKIVERFA